MDVFSIGCVIAELFLEAPIFDLSTLLRYRAGEYDPAETVLQRIEDEEIRSLVAHMIQVDPESRYSAEEYLNFWKDKAFPSFFYSFLHQYMWLITDPSGGRNPVDPENGNFGEADERIDRVYLDFDKIAYFLDYDNDETIVSTRTAPSYECTFTKVLPIQLDLPDNRHPAARRKRRKGADDASLIFLTLVVASVRNTARATARTRACDLMLAFAERLSDDAKLDRVLPFLVTLLNDPSDDVKMAAVRSVVQLLELVDVVSPVNAYVFTEYIRPKLQGMVHDGISSKNVPAVRATYAACLASLAHSSARILDMVQALRADGSIPQIDPDSEAGGLSTGAHRTLYDGARADLVDHFEVHTKALLTDPDASVRRAFLGSVSSLCVFFGPARAADVIISHLNTYLNDKDWMLKCAFFRTIVGVATFIGSTSFEDFILPLMLQALSDPEDFVVEKVISSFASMAELGLFQRVKLFEMIDVVSRFMVHPNYWIREAAVHFVSAASQFLSTADVYCIVLPLLQPYLRTPITELSETTLLDALKRPLSRAVLEMAVAWSQKVEKGIFWKPQKDHRTFSFRGPDHSIAATSSKDLSSKSLQRISKNQEDEQWLNRLQNLGMSPNDDGFKLLALREYISRTARRRGDRSSSTNNPALGSMIGLEDLNVRPQTVVFEKQERAQSIQASPLEDLPSPTRRRGHTITDALLDASQSIDERTPNQRRSSRQESQDSRRGSVPRVNIPRRVSTGPSPLSSSPSTTFGSPDTTTGRPGLLHPDSDGRRHSTATIPEAGRLLSGVDRVKALKHKSSAISLLGRRDNAPGSYGAPQTATTAAQAAGEMDGPFNQENSDDALTPELQLEDASSGPVIGKHIVGHNYRGGDPNVTKLLDSLAAHNPLHDEVEFGPKVFSKQRPAAGLQYASHEPYRPKGIHVATFGEHAGPITRMLAAPDHAFFLSASSDGTVKVWDRHRFERSLIHRARHTHRHSEGASVTCLAFIENTHSFVSCATDGSAHVVKVDFAWIGESPKYGKLRLKRNYQLRRNEHAVWCQHFRASETGPQTSPTSILMLLSNTGRVLALDLRTLNVLYAISIPHHYGTPTTACLGADRTWMLVGTTTGILSLLDLRFRLVVRSWGFPGASPINHISLYERPKYHDTTSNADLQVPLHDERGDRTVVVAGGTGSNDITVWDVEKMSCIEVFRVGSEGATGSGKAIGLATNKDIHRALQPVLVEEMRPEELLARIDKSSATEAGQDQSPRTIVCDSTAPRHTHSSGASVHSGTGGSHTSPTKYLFSGGADRKVRFWAPSALSMSAILSGLGADETQPHFRSVQSSLMPGLALNVELADVKADKAKVEEKRRLGRTLAMHKEQQALLKGHLDVITDIIVLDGREGRFVISADRKGVICVFQ